MEFFNIKGYEDLYKINKKGEVLGVKRNKILSPEIVGGYNRVVLCKNNTTKKHLLHRLVAQTFIPNPENKPFVNHKDGNKLNNNVDNLEWMTQLENTKHAIENGLVDYSENRQRMKNRCGRKITIVNLSTNQPINFICTRDASDFLNVDRTTLSRLINKNKFKPFIFNSYKIISQTTIS